MKIRRVRDLNEAVNRLPGVLAREVHEALLLAQERVFGRLSAEQREWEDKESYAVLESIPEETQSFRQTMRGDGGKGEPILKVQVLAGVTISAEAPTLPTEEQVLAVEDLAEASIAPMSDEERLDTTEVVEGTTVHIGIETQSVNREEELPAFREAVVASSDVRINSQIAVEANKGTDEKSPEQLQSQAHALRATPSFPSPIPDQPTMPSLPRPTKRIISALQKRTKTVPPHQPVHTQRNSSELHATSLTWESQQEGLDALRQHGQRYELLRRKLRDERRRERELRREEIVRENSSAKRYQSRIAGLLEEEKRTQMELEAAKAALFRENRLKQKTYSAVVHELHKPSPGPSVPISFQAKLARHIHSSLSISVTEASPPRKPRLPPAPTLSVKTTRRSLSQSTHQYDSEPSDRSFSRPKDYLREAMEAKGRLVSLRKGFFQYRSQEIDSGSSPQALRDRADRLSRVAVRRDALLHHLPQDQQISASDSVSSMYIDSIKSKLRLLGVLTSVTNG